MTNKIEHYEPGSFCWAELAAKDPDAAKSFYKEMFGWDAMDMPMPEGVYTLFRAEGLDVAAVYKAGPEALPPHWNVYFSVTSVDEAAPKVEPLGGKVVAGPFDVGPAGRMAIAHDPQGSYFSLWQAGQHIGATYNGMLNRPMWPELSTPDPAAAAAFYTGLFGWGTKPETGLETAEYAEWTLGGRSFGGMLPMRGDEWKGIPPHWGIYITVADVDERAAKATELGGRIYVPPRDIPNVGRFSMIADEQGAIFSIIKLSYMPGSASA